MSNLTNRLRNRIEVWGKVEFKNELHETDYNDGLIKSIWCEIIPVGGSIRETEANAIYANVSHRITIRANAIDNLSNNMFFKYNNQKFEINFYQQNYKYKDSIEIFCSLVVE